MLRRSAPLRQTPLRRSKAQRGSTIATMEAVRKVLAPPPGGPPELIVFHDGPVEPRELPPVVSPHRSPGFLQFVGTFSCCYALLLGRIEAAEPHHFDPDRGLGQKCSDLEVVPLSREIHDYVEDHAGCLPGMSQEATLAYFRDVAGILQRLYIQELEGLASTPGPAEADASGEWDGYFAVLTAQPGEVLYAQA